MKRTLAIWLPNWPIQRLLRGHDERVLERPLVLQQRSRCGQCVVACSPAAWQMGIRPEIPVAEARALVRKQPGARTALVESNGSVPVLDVKDYDPHGDRLALEKLAAWCYQFSPLAGLDNADPPETLLLDIHYVSDLFGDESSLIDQISEALYRMQLHFHIGVASTIGAAWAVARFGTGNHASSRHHASSNNAVLIPPGRQREGIGDLPVEALRLSTETLQRLERLGLRKIEQLFALPRSAVQSRFGPILLQRLDQALGAVPELIQVVHPPPEFQTDWLFENPIEHRQTIDQVIKQLVERLCQLLIDYHQGALQLTCRIACQDAAVHEVSVGLFRPSADAAHLLKLLEMHLEQFILSGPVTKIAILATSHAALGNNQTPLFDQPQRRHDSAIVGSVVDRIAGRLGRDAVVSCVPQKDAQPEQAFRYEPVIGSDSFFAKNKRQHSAGKRPSTTKKLKPPKAPQAGDVYPLALCPLDRPLHLFPKPVAIQVDLLQKEELPNDFVWQNKRYKVARRWGPERIETGWWRNRGVRRDYYRVETTSGHRYWLFQCLSSRQWYLHGTFG